jgi:hypothetical protein
VSLKEVWLRSGDAILSLWKPDGTAFQGIAAQFSPDAIPSQGYGESDSRG